jgi:multidrug transporter EmrE-like cation transporter
MIEYMIMKRSIKVKNIEDNKNNKVINKKISLKPILLVILCTLFTSSGQILWKLASKNLNSFTSIITNVPLIIGFVCYGVGAILLIISLKYGDLSLVYPFVALSFIWVSIASIFLFNEFISIINWTGIAAIMLGVSLIGYGGSK